MNDLTVSLKQAYLNGRNATNGPMICCDTVNAASIMLPVSKPSRYYLAISTSGMCKSSPIKERIYSGWKLYTSADSIPVQILEGIATTLYTSA
ncbi:MAG: hypothetical protein GX639_04280 [Fibrobacter sp.]|nr:hypothetical protein [Fibrobacter sp.]